MAPKLSQNKFRINEQNISYYNEIADSYDNILDQKDSNKIIRQKIAKKFCDIVEGGNVLDFGGGTGLDLEWLVNKGYSVFFCEPSSGMREKAVNYNKNFLHNNSIIFLDDNRTDFTQWNKQLPFPSKVDAVLANFAVINNIADIALLFNALSLVSKPGAHFIALILDNDFKKTLRSRLYRNIRSFIFRKPFSFQIQHKENRQTVFIYTIKEIKRASAGFFDFCSHEFLYQSGFSLIHLIRK